MQEALMLPGRSGKKVLNCNFPVDRWMVEEKVLHLLLSKKRKRQDFCGGFHTVEIFGKSHLHCKILVGLGYIF